MNNKPILDYFHVNETKVNDEIVVWDFYFKNEVNHCNGILETPTRDGATLRAYITLKDSVYTLFDNPRNSTVYIAKFSNYESALTALSHYAETYREFLEFLRKNHEE